MSGNNDTNNTNDPAGTRRAKLKGRARTLGVGAALVAAVVTLLVVRARLGQQPLPDFDALDRPDGAPRYYMQLQASASGRLQAYPGRDYDYHTGEPVLATVFLKPAAGSRITEFEVRGPLKEMRRQVTQRHDAQGKPIVQLDLRLQCMELEKVWRCDIDVGYEQDGQDKVVSVPISVTTSATYQGETHSGHPDDAPLLRYSALPAVFTSFGLAVGGLMSLFVGVHLIMGKRLPGIPPPTPQEALWLAIDQEARRHLASMRMGQVSPKRCQALGLLLRRRFSLPTCDLMALPAVSVRMRENELLTGGALFDALAICDQAVTSDQELDAGDVARLTLAVEGMLGAAARRAKRRFSWLTLVKVLALLPFVAIYWPLQCLACWLLGRWRRHRRR